MSFKNFLEMRGVHDPCKMCQGLGTIMYWSTSTWRGGMGGSSMTHDVCNACWGSGDAFSHGVDLRKLRGQEAHRVAVEAGRLLADRCVVSFSTMHPGILELCDELDKFGRGRKPRENGFYAATRCLAKMLRELVLADVKERGG